MPLMLDDMRREFARVLAEDPAARWRMDTALAHVVALAYAQGITDGEQQHSHRMKSTTGDIRWDKEQT